MPENSENAHETPVVPLEIDAALLWEEEVYEEVVYEIPLPEDVEEAVVFAPFEDGSGGGTTRRRGIVQAAFVSR